MSKLAIVTGVSYKTGLGYAICRKLLEENYKVIAIYNTTNECEDLFANMPIEFLQCDFTNKHSLACLIDALRKEKIDLLVNNAGKFAENEDYLDYNMQSWDDVFDVNVRAPAALSTGLAPSFNSNAVIINISSTDGFIGAFTSFSYSASKAALNNLTESLAINFGYDKRRIRVVGIAISWAKTDVTMIPPISWKVAPQLTPLERFAEPHEIADLIAFVISNKANYITGTNIKIDGGYSIVNYGYMREAGRKIED